MKLNPFTDEGISNYDQFKLYPFIIRGAMSVISNKIDMDIHQIKNKIFFGERILLIGSRGIGKTSALFFIKKKLDKGGINNYVLSHLVEDHEHLKSFISKSLDEVSENGVYFLIDFPDTFDPAQYKKFLSFLWLIITHKKYNKINLIFALNHSHFEKSFNYSEILGKFMTLRLEQFNLENTKELIESRLNIVNMKISDLMGDEVINLIYNHTNGIPRNIISACNVIFSKYEGKPIDIKIASEEMNEKYFDQILNDRVEDKSEREIYRNMILLMKDKFKGICNSKVEYINLLNTEFHIGKNTLGKKLKDLIKFGIIVEKKGGERRINRILSLN